MKKESVRLLSLLLIFSILFTFSIQFVSAQTALKDVSSGIVTGISSVFQFAQADKNTFSSILLGILLYIVLFSIVKQVFHFEGNYSYLSAGGVSLIIVVLTFLYLPANFIETVVLQYSALGLTMLTIIPLVILMYFTAVVTKNLFVARAIWLFYSMYYFGLFAYKLATTSSGSVFGNAENIPFMAAIIIGLVLFFIVGVVRKKIFTETLNSGEEHAMKSIRLRAAERKMEEKEAESRGLVGGAGI